MQDIFKKATEYLSKLETRVIQNSRDIEALMAERTDPAVAAQQNGTGTRHIVERARAAPPKADRATYTDFVSGGYWKMSRYERVEDMTARIIRYFENCGDGVKAAQMARSFGVPTIHLSHPLNKLREAGAVRTEGRAHYTTWHAVDLGAVKR